MLQSPKGAGIHRRGLCINLDFRNASAWNRHCGRWNGASYGGTTYKVLRLTTKSLQLHTRKYYAVLPSIPPYYKALLRTIQSTRLLMHLQKYNISRSGSPPEIWPKTAPTTKIATPKSSNTAPVTKNNTPKSPNGAYHRKWLSNITKCCACHKKVSSFPFLTVALLLLSWLACSVSQLQHSFPELILYWVFLCWTFPWLNYSFLNCSFTELAFDELYLYCTLLLPNYSSTELVLYWTTPFFCFLNLRNSEVSQPNFLWQQPTHNNWYLISNIPKKNHKLLKTLGHARHL